MRQRSLPPKVKTQQPAMREIPPNAGKTIAALRELGYDSITAICDIVDNGIDAGAKNVWITVKEVGKALMIDIVDDGAGMDEKQLTEALRIGSESSHEDDDLGKFGIGLKTAGMSIARCILVLSRQKGGTGYEANLDLDLIAQQNKWLLPMRAANSKAVLETVGDHGTMVRLSNIDRISDKNIGRFTANLRSRIGQVYRHYLAQGIRIMVNNRAALRRDPLMLDHPLTQVVLDEDLNIGSDNVIHLKAVELPELTMAESEAAGILPHASGFYVIRNGREIIEAQTFGFYRHHHSYSHFRCEISFKGTTELDRLLHVDIKKGSIHPERSILEKLQAKVGRYIVDSGRKGRDTTATQVKLTHAAANTIDLPSLSANGDEPKKTKATDATPDALAHAPVETAQGKAVSFTSADHGEDGPFMHPSKVDGKITVSYNTRHPLWQHLTKRRQVDPLFDYLVFSMAYVKLLQPGPSRPVLAKVDATLRGLLAGLEGGSNGV